MRVTKTTKQISNLSASEQIDYLFYATKTFDIGLTTTYFLVFGSVLSLTFERLFWKYEEKVYESRSTMNIVAEILLQCFCIGVAAYVLRLLIKKIPSPVDGIRGFSHARIKELGGGVLLGFATMAFQTSLIEKIKLIARRTLISEAISKPEEEDQTIIPTDL